MGTECTDSEAARAAESPTQKQASYGIKAQSIIACSAMGVAMPQILEFPRGAIIFDPEIIKIVAQAFR
jgi:hypothetical protein